MSIYEIAILVSIAVIGVMVITGLAVWAIATLTANLKNERNRNMSLEDRIAKLEEATDKPIGYNQMAAFDELTAFLVGIEKRCQIAREFSNAAKRGNFKKND